MTEFALIVPVFLVIVVGLLGFGRVFFYWIETNHEASETARWAVVDRNPPLVPTPAHRRRTAVRRSSSTRSAGRRRVHRTAQRLHRLPGGGTLDLGKPVRVKIAEAVHASCRSSASDRSRSGRRRRMRIERFATAALRRSTTTTPDPRHRDVLVSTLLSSGLRDERGGDPRPRGRDDSGVPPLDRARRRRRATGTRTSASCRTGPTPARSRQASSTSPQLKNCVTTPAHDRHGDRDRREALCGRREEAIAGTKYNQTIAEQADLNVAINATNAATADDTRTAANPCVDHARATRSAPVAGSGRTSRCARPTSARSSAASA